MSEPAHPESAPSSRTDLSALVAKLSLEEIATLRQLLAGREALLTDVGSAATVDHEIIITAEVAENDSSNGEPLLELHAQETVAPEPSSRAAPAVPMPEVPGYEIVKEIGRGGMGVVYLARQVRLNRMVALKMILAGTAAGEQELERFRQEAETVARFQHASIVQVFEVGECAVGAGTSCPYMVLELCSGGSLAALLDGTPWPAEEAAHLIEMLARTVHAAHQAGIVHRDLKPANVLLSMTSEGQTAVEEDFPFLSSALGASCAAKITDFGLAKRINDERGRTQSGAILGTPEYMAPEQAAGKIKAIGPLADVYALGAILYELLTGRPPLRGDTILDTLVMVMEQEPTPPRMRHPTVPRKLEIICLKCLRKEPGQRYSSALELADDLRRFLHREPILARPPGILERANRLLSRRSGLTLAYLVFAVAVGLYVQLIGVRLSSIFVLNRISPSGFQYLVLPSAALTMAVLVVADLRMVSLAGLVLGLVGTALWFAVPNWRPTIDPSWLFLRPLAGFALLAVLLGFLRGKGMLLLFFLPALAIAAGSAWLSEDGLAAFWAGVCHGLLLGLLARVIAWSLNRDRAVCAFGTALGACVGLVVADRMGIALRTYLMESGLGSWHMTIYSLYLETCLAFAAAVVLGLGAGRRPSASNSSRL